MRKTVIIISVLALFCCTLFPSCSKKPQVKVIPASHVKLSGEHKDFIEVAGDAKVMLVEVMDDLWEVRAVVPIRNTAPWSAITGGDEEFEAYLDPRMGSAKVAFCDAYGSELYLPLCKTVLDNNVIESVLKSEKQTTEDLLIKDKRTLWGAKEYKAKRKIYEQVDGIVISDMSITKGEQKKDYDQVMTRIEGVLDLIVKAQTIGLW
jgi:hypothetical protein